MPCRRCQEAVEERLILATGDRWSIEQEGELEKFVTLLATEPAVAVKELKRFALGLAWLIESWEGLRSLMEREAASSADVREELTVFDAGDANQQVLGSEETDYLHACTACWRKATRGKPRLTRVLPCP